jgi:hypothetical protein
MPPAADAAAPAAEAPDSNVLVTITSDGQGGFMVYPGDEPEEDETGDMSGDDAAAMGPSGDEPASQGEPADSVGAALKLAMTILQSAASGGAGPNNAADNFASGFGAPPAGGSSAIPQKY